MSFSEAMGEQLDQNGIQFYFETVVDHLQHHGNGVRAILSKGQQIDADIVLCAVGIKPNIDLAKSAGLSCDKGIVVDFQLRTSVEGIYAIGDCCQALGQVLPYIAPLNYQVKALARHLSNEEVALSYDVMPVVVKSKLYPVTFHIPQQLTGNWVVA